MSRDRRITSGREATYFASTVNRPEDGRQNGFLGVAVEDPVYRLCTAHLPCQGALPGQLVAILIDGIDLLIRVIPDPAD